MSTTTTNLGLTKPDYTDIVDVEPAINDNLDILDTEVNKKLNKTGDASNTVSYFSQYSTLTNIQSGETLAVVHSKIKKMIADFIAFMASFQSGLELIANAITRNGVSTSPTDAPTTFVSNIFKIRMGGTATEANVLAGKTFHAGHAGTESGTIKTALRTGTMTDYSSNVQTVPTNKSTGSGVYTYTALGDGYHTAVKINQYNAYRSGAESVRFNTSAYMKTHSYTYHDSLGHAYEDGHGGSNSLTGSTTIPLNTLYGTSTAATLKMISPEFTCGGVGVCSGTITMNIYLGSSSTLLFTQTASVNSSTQGQVIDSGVSRVYFDLASKISSYPAIYSGYSYLRVEISSSISCSSTAPARVGVDITDIVLMYLQGS